MVTLNKYVFKTIDQKYFIMMSLVYVKSRLRCLFTLILTPKPVSLTCTCKSSVESNATQVFQCTRASESHQTAMLVLATSWTQLMLLLPRPCLAKMWAFLISLAMSELSSQKCKTDNVGTQNF